MKVEFEFTGIEEMIQQLRRAARDYPAAGAQALYEEGFRIEADAVKNTPVKSGRLRSTAYVAPPVDDGKSIRVTIGYGTDYAVPVHERTEAHHPVGEAKFLEHAMDRASNNALERIGRRIQELVESGRGVAPLPPKEG